MSPASMSRTLKGARIGHVVLAPGRSAAGPLGPRARLSARPPACASGRWPRYFPLLAAPRPGRSGHGLAYRLALRAAGAAPCRVPPSLVLVSAGPGAGLAVAFSLPPWG